MSYDRLLHRAVDEDPLNVRTRAFLGDPNALEELDPNDPENMPPEQIKAVALAAQRADQHQQDVIARAQTADIFIAGRPELIDNQHNAKLMTSTLIAMFGDVRFSLEDYEAAFAHLSEAGLLQLNQAEVKKRKNAENKQRYDAEQARIAAGRFDTSADYDSLSLDEIKRRANQQMQSEMQRRGEEGGW